MVAGLVVAVVFVTGPRDPGGEYVGNCTWFTSAAGTISYVFTAMLASCILWPVATVARRNA